MKKLLTNLSLAAATILLLGSCAKINERIDDLEGRINGLEKESIASINSQIESINSSIADLGTIRTNIQNLTSTTAAQAQDIADLNNEDTEIGKKISDLKKADESINARIDDLQKYVNDTLKAYATTEWVNATFSTLAQYEATCDTIAKIDARIGAMDTRLSKSIEDCADSLKSWVNVQLDGYYTIAQMDAKVTEMNAQIDTLSSTSAATADNLKAEIAATKAEIDTIKANIRAEYKSAIETAITALDGKLSAAQQTAIAQVNNSILLLNSRVSNLEISLADLTPRVDALDAMIQSVVIVPAYSDGSVKVDKDSLYIDCLVSPDTVVKKLDTAKVVILVNKVKTKAFAGVDTVKIGTGDIFEKDTTNGSLSIRVNIANKIPTSDDSTITVALNIKNGISNFTTKFVPVYVAGPALPEGALSGEFSVSATKKVYFSKGNLWAGSNNALHFEANQYSFASDWNASHVSHFTWSSTVAAAVSENNSGNNLFCDESHKVSVDGSETIYYALSKDEWTYLFNSRSMTDDGARYENLTSSGITVESVTFKGVVLFPDNFTDQADWKTKYTTWEALNNAGIVFLPAAGNRYWGTSFDNVGEYGLYRSSTVVDATQAYVVFFDSSNVTPDRSNLVRDFGYSVRLVTEVK